MRKFILILTALAIYSTSFGQVVTPFFVRKSITQNGGIIYLSNVSVKASPTSTVQNQIPPSGTGINDNYRDAYVDVDNDATTFMSSSDSLNLPSCSEISWAGLYWGGEDYSGKSNWTTHTQVKIKANSGTYRALLQIIQRIIPLVTGRIIALRILLLFYRLMD